jgi:hypothetical protein
MFRGGVDDPGGRRGEFRMIAHSRRTIILALAQQFDNEKAHLQKGAEMMNLKNSPNNLNPPLRLNLFRDITFPTPLF